MSRALEHVSVIIPALNEEDTVAGVIEAVAADGPGEILVIDSDSVDGTAVRAQQAGARVVNWRDILPDVAPRPGKGEALWRGVAAATRDIVVFVDADLTSLRSGMINALVEPFEDPEIHMVKADYRRAFEGRTTGGGRVTELTAKPLMRLYFPELVHINQPLGGEYALRLSTARGLSFVEGFGVEAGLLIDVARGYGVDAIAQVDLGVRRHENQPLEDLGPMADIVAATILGRAGVYAGSVGERGALDSCARGSTKL